MAEEPTVGGTENCVNEQVGNSQINVQVATRATVVGKRRSGSSSSSSSSSSS
eukprot:CAMPEP_0115349848 /NCGR_PEP_ID=MMETSP0270-20121206/96152_1 /TAXON_ID=71861 /ORGANISM="Scrippsiella trochoidea, Strain CCMP3099" /LENGTH=51 /DNA_ID=CAMNT_0002771903 /DNA_START=33 /DNA_END=184 /DNA_ORIENTATION=-